MATEQHHGGGVILLTFIVAFMLTIIPLPDWAEAFRPEWVTMVLVYWIMALPGRIGVGTAWLAGLMLDVSRGALLGQYALALTVVALVTHVLHQRFRVYPIWQQAMVIFLLVALELIPVVWVNGVIGQPAESWLFWAPTFTSMLFWPWAFLMLRDLRRRFQVN